MEILIRYNKMLFLGEIPYEKIHWKIDCCIWPLVECLNDNEANFSGNGTAWIHLLCLCSPHKTPIEVDVWFREGSFSFSPSEHCLIFSSLTRETEFNLTICDAPSHYCVHGQLLKKGSAIDSRELTPRSRISLEYHLTALY